jgi:cyclase
MRKRSLILSFFVALAGLALFVSRTDATPETIAKIAPGVWFREGDLKNLGHCNNIVIEMKDYLIVVDANFPSGARATMADVKRVSSKPVKYVFDTHHHGDHSYGNAVWTDAGATTLAYVGVAQEMRRYEPARWQQTAKERKDVAAMNRPSVEPPKQTFRRQTCSSWTTARAKWSSISSAGRTRAATASSTCPRSRSFAPATRW